MKIYVYPNSTKQQYVVILVQLLKMTNFFSRSALSLLVILFTPLAFEGCATPAERFNDTAAKLGFYQQQLAGAPYQHRLFINTPAHLADRLDKLHVYLDGDGTPWRSGTRIADDPTPRNPLILEI